MIRPELPQHVHSRVGFRVQLSQREGETEENGQLADAGFKTGWPTKMSEQGNQAGKTTADKRRGWQEGSRGGEKRRCA